MHICIIYNIYIIYIYIYIYIYTYHREAGHARESRARTNCRDR
jgi:hypothetical protein